MKSKKRRKRDPKKTAERKALKEWAAAIKERANNQCEWCGTKKYLNAHHIISKRFKPLRFHRMNGIALCPRCHKFGIGIAAHENPIRTILWLMEQRPEDFQKLCNYTEEVLKNG